MEKTKNSSVKILLENTSGSGSWLGYTFKHQKQVFDSIRDKERLGLCLDTAHAYLAGYDISTGKGLKKTLDEIEQCVGLRYLKLIHLNDTNDKLGSLHDRDTHIGQGNIGAAGMKRIINHPALRSLPFILETPKKNERDDPMNLAMAKKLRQK